VDSEVDVLEEPAEEVAEDAAVPEPVEVQLAAAGAGKDADIFAVVMVGLLALSFTALQSFNSGPDKKMEKNKSSAFLSCITCTRAVSCGAVRTSCFCWGCTLGCVVNRLLTEMCTQCLLGCAGHCVSKLIFIPTDLVVKTYNCVQLQNAGSANDASSEFRELLCAVICDYRRKLF
jgi:hypothetical protein